MGMQQEFKQSSLGQTIHDGIRPCIWKIPSGEEFHENIRNKTFSMEEVTFMSP